MRRRVNRTRRQRGGRGRKRFQQGTIPDHFHRADIHHHWLQGNQQGLMGGYGNDNYGSMFPTTDGIMGSQYMDELLGVEGSWAEGYYTGGAPGSTGVAGGHSGHSSNGNGGSGGLPSGLYTGPIERFPKGPPVRQRGGRVGRQQGGPGSNLPTPWGNED